MKSAVLIVNLGTPLSSAPRDVFRYLVQFLTDKRVIDFSWLKRQCLVRGIIVPLRYRQSARQYQAVWMKEGSPLLVYGKEVREKLQAKLGPDFIVALAMRYQEPSIASALSDLKRQDIDELLILPLFPQQASATTGSVFQEVMEQIKGWDIFPRLCFIPQFFNHPGFIRSFVKKAELYDIHSYDHFVFSFHGLPLRYLLRDREKKNGDYKKQCEEGALAIINALKIDPLRHTVCFQSRLGKEPWIEPYTSDVLEQLAHEGKKRVLLFSPSFVCDCLETLYEIGVEYEEEFQAAGGSKLQLVEGLNGEPLWIEALQEIVLTHSLQQQKLAKLS